MPVWESTITRWPPNISPCCKSLFLCNSLLSAAAEPGNEGLLKNCQDYHCKTFLGPSFCHTKDTLAYLWWEILSLLNAWTSICTLLHPDPPPAQKFPLMPEERQYSALPPTHPQNLQASHSLCLASRCCTNQQLENHLDLFLTYWTDNK